MAFELYKPGPTSTTPMEDWLASGAIAAGDVVKLVAASCIAVRYVVHTTIQRTASTARRVVSKGVKRWA